MPHTDLAFTLHDASYEISTTGFVVYILAAIATAQSAPCDVIMPS